MRKDKSILLLLLLLLFIAIPIFGQWQPLNGPKGGYIRSILSEGQTVYAASTGGVMVSNNNGANWSFKNNGLKSCDTKCLVTLENYVFVATDENVF